MQRRTRTTLYEVMHPPPGASGGSLPGDRGSAQHDPRERLSIGAVATAVAIVAVLCAGAYLAGYARGRAAGFEQGREQPAQRVAVADPTLQPLPPSGAPPLPSGGGGGATGPETNAEATDPRQRDLNYFILAQVEPERAAGMVEFLRNRGLDAHAAKWDNGRFLQVFVLPGFEGSRLKSNEAESLKRQVLDAGRAWKSAAPGNEDFRSHYPRKFLGP